MFLQISTHFTATPGIPLSSPILKLDSIQSNSGVEPRTFTIRLIKPPALPLRPVIPNNACNLRITAAAGTELAVAYSLGTVRAKAFYSSACSSLIKGLYDPKAFIVHAAWLRQTFVHCAIFPTAATRRCLDRVSVPVWPANLSVRLPIAGLVRFYHTNYLMGGGLISQRAKRPFPCKARGLCNRMRY